MQGLYSLSGRMSYGKISRSLEVARYGFKHFSSLWNLTGTSAAPLPKCLLNFRAIRSLSHPISRLRDFARFGGKTSYRLVNRGPVSLEINHWNVHCSTPVGAPFCPMFHFAPTYYIILVPLGRQVSSLMCEILKWRTRYWRLFRMYLSNESYCIWIHVLLNYFTWFSSQRFICW